VYFTGIVRDKIGRKMSKSLGNSPDPLDLIDKFGADGVRMGLMLSAPAGNDIMYDDALVEQGRNFANKIWNAFRLIQGWNVDENIPQPESSKIAVDWFRSQLHKTMIEVEDLMGKFRISEALMAVYKLFWDEFSSWYLEVIKPAYGSPIDGKTYSETMKFFEMLLQLLHPFMPFITEELWQHLAERNDGDSIMNTTLPAPGEVDEALLSKFETLKEIITGLRAIRKQRQIANKEAISVDVKGPHDATLDSVLLKMGNVSDIKPIEEKGATSVAFLVGPVEYSVPLADKINVEEELAKLEKELKRYEGFLAGVEKKLSNERFVANAPEQVIALERKKQSDATEKIAAIKASIAALK
ncbi:MAG: class I tRNA ligase family protein, partial [Muribaculaceae bacterium]|nr:class I tRNA ligase family protein [Muribaculaceae bacterium]